MEWLFGGKLGDKFVLFEVDVCDIVVFFKMFIDGYWLVWVM